MKQTYHTALYMRLSRDDETYGDSVSILRQTKSLLRCEYLVKRRNCVSVEIISMQLVKF